MAAIFWQRGGAYERDNQRGEEHLLQGRQVFFRGSFLEGQVRNKGELGSLLEPSDFAPRESFRFEHLSLEVLHFCSHTLLISNVWMLIFYCLKH